MDIQPASATLADLLQDAHSFLQPAAHLEASLSAAKQILDPLAAGVSETQYLRQQELRRKRKRGGGRDANFPVLQLKKLHLDGFGVNQVFEQARKIVDATADEVELALPDEDERIALVSGPNQQGERDKDEDEHVETLDESDSSLGEEGVDWEYDGEDISGGDDADTESDMAEGEDNEHAGVDMDMDVDMDVDTDGEEGMFSGAASDDEPAETYQPDPNGLNDGFFSIDDFNRQSDFFEQQDERGEPPASDDEEIDWDGDPFSQAAPHASNDEDGFSDQEGSDEGAPTFGNMDLNAPEGASDDEGGDELLEDGDLDGRGDTGNANNIMYADFFLPPPARAGKNRNKNKNKKGRPHPHNFPAAADSTNNDKPDEDDINRTISAVQRDLFEDEDDLDAPSDADSLSDLDPSDPKSRRSTHERRQHKLAEQIRRLESENVAKRAWQLSGEVSSRARPMNSLLEEDLGFEHLGKPVPMITAEVSESLEALIKRRILAGEFDEIRRRRPDDLATGPKTRRGQMDVVDDTKSSKPLGDLYEEEFRRQNDASFVDAQDEKLRKEHETIEALWKNVSAKLDSLSSWHYKPKPAAPNLEIRVDAPVITMEDARPTAGGDVAGASALAPQEVYKPGDERTKGEVVTKAGVPIAREEMTREQKESARRREKSRAKKRALGERAPQTMPGKAEQQGGAKGKKEKEKKDLIGTLKKGGVQVIGKKGQVTDVEGREVRERVRSGAGGFKL